MDVHLVLGQLVKIGKLMIGFRKIEKKESKDFLKHNRIFLQKKTQN